MTEPVDALVDAPVDALVDAVVFDVGNVLIEWDRGRLYRELIPDDVERKRFLEQVLTTHVNLALDAGAAFGPTLDALAEVCPQWREEILAFGPSRRWIDTLGPEDGEMVRLAADLRAAGVGVYALTNFSAETWPLALERHPWLDGLDGVVVSGAERVVKPSAAIYEILLERYDLDRATTWFTDDSPRNVEGARAVGLRAEVFVDAASTRAHLRDLGLRV